MFRVFGLLLGIAAFSGCATAPPAAGEDPLTAMLGAATTDIKAALYMLAETQNAVAQKGLTRQQKQQALIAATRTPAGMDKPVTLEWAGPIEGALKSLAEQAGYRYQVHGQAPLSPIIVRLEAKQAPAIVAVRDVAFQAGERAKVSVFEQARTLQLRYANAL